MPPVGELRQAVAHLIARGCCLDLGLKRDDDNIGVGLLEQQTGSSRIARIAGSDPWAVLEFAERA